MKKNIIIAIASLMLFASCGTYTGAGAGAGAYWGQSIGGAIGGLSHGHRGYHAGSLVGMASGAIIGAAIGSAKDAQHQEDMRQYYAEKERLAQNKRARKSTQYQSQYAPQGEVTSGFDETNSGDDRIFDLDIAADNSYPSTNLPSSQSTSAVNIEVRNARFFDGDGDNAISRGEKCKVTFEVYNRGTSTVYDLQPFVIETSGNKHVFVSQNTPVQSLAPGKGIKYTALVVGDTSLKNGAATISLSVLHNGVTVTPVSVFDIVTRK